ncbi:MULTISPECIES: helix-turn-helix transcriptional regulator [Mycobacterium]|uniref:helix-turn-helix transcriptional regulator n=1 Tax=Mycobacterium TaxID=1763 RepID=UPI001CDA4E96|nr:MULTISPECIES: helix-turn-helix transcriptional regulator [Mycobacterium]MCA2245304.1 helix-turn-helix transcriptional regulator [Mycobacterium sp. WUMAC-067]MCA2316909.1 helix-turn-helix transcriptional regulator [Mycobacterium sp. WUMAC-025]MEE3754853.1 helix-turn-helix transcriptional regulator [Mycobacterium intracellulare]
MTERIRRRAMVTVEDFSRLVADIYAAAVAPQQWDAAIRDVQRVLGGTGGSLLMGGGSVWSFQDSTLPLAALETYAEHYRRLDYVLERVQNGPIGVVRTGPEIIVPNRNAEFYTGWMQPNELEDGLFVRLTGGPRPTCFLVMSSKRYFDAPERVKLVGSLVVHLQQAVRTQDQFAAVVERNTELARALDAIRDAVIVVGTDCRVINLNSAAEDVLRGNDGLHTESGRIGAINMQTERELHCALHGALIGGESGLRGGRSLICRRPSGLRPYVIQVIPLHRIGTSERAGEPSALVLIKDPERETESAATLLRRLYRLTEGEAEVALRLTHGAGLKQIADELSVSYETVRTHLQHAFDKTDTHRQAELVGLVLALTP